ncbi:LysE/ArgO family amino acid transporter [Mangrovicoccus sp. HB161399]|uniref:LysE/ArgO family amino acid transporter n=1 Tax=Mangrovicoccus sp. HB161399 TaxID=2720392 RepID=UPI0015576BCB|nr:LysE family transporter [Mangrovicoccus sp. HB161399]
MWAGAAATGFATGLSLIVAIGAQNAFVLRQGLLQSHVLPLCLFCALSDAVLIAAGVAGFGALVRALPWVPGAMAALGAAFLVGYALLRLRDAAKGGHDLAMHGRSASLLPTLLTAAAFTWANPHVYLDTLGLIGAVSTQYAGPAKTAFALGAIAASFAFFFSLGYGAQFLAPLMRSPRAWRRLDILIAVTMLILAANLVHGLAA